MFATSSSASCCAATRPSSMVHRVRRTCVYICIDTHRHRHRYRHAANCSYSARLDEHACARACVRVSAHTCVCARVRACVRTCVCVRACTRVCMCVCRPRALKLLNKLKALTETVCMRAYARECTHARLCMRTCVHARTCE